MNYTLTRRGKQVNINFLLHRIIPSVYRFRFFNIGKSVDKIKRSNRLNTIEAFETPHRERMSL